MTDRPTSAVVSVIHTSRLTTNTYATLFAELAPDIAVAHFIDDTLLDDWRAAGGPNRLLVERVGRLIERAIEAPPALVLSQCSSIGDAVAEFSTRCPVPLLRVDEPMVERAVDVGGRIGIVATLPTTLGPTRNLVEAKARARGCDIEVETLLVEGAFDRLAAGAHAEHDTAVAAAIRDLATRVDVILCAQGSMAPAALGLADLGKPIWTSPRLGVARAADLVRGMFSNV
jgi:hypothetical protein